MYWILDVLVVLFAVIVAICGYKRGLADAISTTLFVILLFVLALAGAAGFVLLLYKVGAVNDFAYAFLGVLGETNSLFSMLGLTAFDVAQSLAAVVFFILGCIISTILVSLLSKAVRNLIKRIPHTGVFGVIMGVLGLILYLALYLGVMLALFGLVNALSAKNVEFFVRIGECLESCPICGWLYKINPLNSVFAGFIR